jgi:Flp pilus assembly secretin CpaC
MYRHRALIGQRQSMDTRVNCEAGLGRLLFGAILFLMTSAASAGDREVILGLGNPSRLALGRMFDTVIVANPLIIDVSTDDDQSVLIRPRNPGVTNLVFVDAQGRVIANYRILVCESVAACDAAAGRT